MRHLLAFLSFALLVVLNACSSNDLYEDMPQEIQSFVSQYYPNSQLESFTSSDNTYTVVLKNGPSMTFADNYQWISINGNGSVLPQVLLFNDLPPALYDYLQETETTDQVFSLSRNSRIYTVKLLTRTLTYEISTSEITGSESEPD